MSNKAAWEAFRATEGRKLAPKPKRQPSKSERTKGLPRGKKRINQESIKQAYRRGHLNGVKAERLSKQQDEGDERGLFHCEFPDCTYGTDDLEEAKKMHLHHAGTQRSLGARATPENWGVDDPGSLLLLCTHHHKLVHEPMDEPQWTRRPA